MTYFVWQHFNMDADMPNVYDMYIPLELTELGMSTSEIHEFKTYWIAFPNVPQHLFLRERLDQVEGQYLHVIQLPKYALLDLASGLVPAH